MWPTRRAARGRHCGRQVEQVKVAPGGKGEAVISWLTKDRLPSGWPKESDEWLAVRFGALPERPQLLQLQCAG